MQVSLHCYIRTNYFKSFPIFYYSIIFQEAIKYSTSKNIRYFNIFIAPSGKKILRSKINFKQIIFFFKNVCYKLKVNSLNVKRGNNFACSKNNKSNLCFMCNRI